MTTEPKKSASKADDPEGAIKKIKQMHIERRVSNIDEETTKRVMALAEREFGTGHHESLIYIADLTIGMLKGSAWYGGASARKRELIRMIRLINSLTKLLNETDTRLLISTPYFTNDEKVYGTSAVGTSIEEESQRAGYVLPFSLSPAEKLLSRFYLGALLSELRRDAEVAVSYSTTARGRKSLPDPISFCVEMLLAEWKKFKGRLPNLSKKANMFLPFAQEFGRIIAIPEASIETSLLRHFSFHEESDPKNSS